MSDIWKPIPSSGGFYECSDAGVIRTVATGHIKRSYVVNGYLKVKLYMDGRERSCQVNRLVCEAFHGPPSSRSLQAAHWDGNKFNNVPLNLRWATRKENEADKIRHGRTNRGERNGMAKLTPSDIRVIRREFASLAKSSGGARIKKGATIGIEKRFGITRSSIYGIVSGLRWRNCE